MGKIQELRSWKARCSSLGHLTTKVETITDKQADKIKELEKRQAESQIEGSKVKPLTPTMQKELEELITKRDAPDELPTGAQSHLDDVFRSLYWGRSRFLYNKFLDKGKMVEQDGCAFLSDYYDDFIDTNKVRFENDFISGEPDIILDHKIIDLKSSWDRESFEKAELTQNYKWQLKGYIWILERYTGITRLGELNYVLVNTPQTILDNEKNILFYKMGSPADDDPRYVEARRQLEKNMIFDIGRFKERYPFYQWENEKLDFDMPPEARFKPFKVELEWGERGFIKRRVRMARKYLVEKARQEEENMNKTKIYLNQLKDE